MDAENEKTEPTRSRYFIRPSIDNLKSFFDFHLHQLRTDVPFNKERAYFRVDANDEKVHRQWLTYASEERTVHCSICIAKSSDGCSLVTLITRSISIRGLKNTNNARLTLLMLMPSWSISQNA